MVQPSGGGGVQNMNPTMTDGLTMGPHSAHVMNVLGAPQMLNNAAMVDLGLEGMPGGMFDWGESLHSSDRPQTRTTVVNAGLHPAGQWDTFFQRFSGGSHPAQA